MEKTKNKQIFTSQDIEKALTIALDILDIDIQLHEKETGYENFHKAILLLRNQLTSASMIENVNGILVDLYKQEQVQAVTDSLSRKYDKSDFLVNRPDLTIVSKDHFIQLLQNEYHMPLDELVEAVEYWTKVLHNHWKSETFEAIIISCIRHSMNLKDYLEESRSLPDEDRKPTEAEIYDDELRQDNERNHIS